MDGASSTLVLPVLGVPVRFDADAPALLEAVEASFGAWAALDDDLVDAVGASGRAPRVRLRMARTPRAGAPRGPVRIESRPGGRLLFRDPGLVAGRATLGGMEAAVRVTPEGLAHPRALGEALDTLTLFLITRLDRQPVHASALASGGRGLVLAGPSGVGKSTLAYAALDAGVHVLTDDAVYVQLRPGLRVWGLGRPLHLVPEAAEWFPALADRPLVRRAGDRLKRSVDPGAWDGGAAPVAESVGLCLLARSSGAPRVEGVSAEAVVGALARDLDPGFDAFRDSIAARLRALAAGGAWRVELGEQPHEALPLLLDLLGRVPS